MTQLAEHFGKLIEQRIETMESSVFSIEKSANLPPDAIRNALRRLKSGENPAGPTLSRTKEICDALGLEFYIGPPRDLSPAREEDRPASWSTFSTDTQLPQRGFASCSAKGWGKAQPLKDPLPAPEALDDPEAFYVTAAGKSMVPEGIKPSSMVLVSPGKEVAVGDRVWITSFQSETSLKRLIEIRDDTIVVQGWLPPVNGEQKSFTEEHVTRYLKRLAPVVAVYNGVPGNDNVEHIPDPKVDQAASVSEDLAGDYTLIKMHPLQQEVADGIVLADKSVISGLAFPNYWLRHHGIVPSQASLLAMGDDDMEPTFGEGTIVMLNHTRTRVRTRQVYAFMFDDAMHIKRLEQLSPNQLLVMSDNPKYPSQLLHDDQLEDVEIIGEVIWAGRKFS